MALGDIIYRGASVWLRLVGNSTTSKKFLSQTGTGSASAAPAWSSVALEDLSDVSLSSPPSDGDVLTYSSASPSGWVNEAPSGGASELDDLTDVTITSPSTGDALIYNGSAWVNDTAGTASALDDLTDVTISSPTDGQLLAYQTGSPAGWVNHDPPERCVGITIDGGGATITTGVKGFVQVPFSGTITNATLLSTDASATTGSIVIDVWKDTVANYPPTDADSITASAPPTLSADNEVEDSTLSGWTTSVSAGDVLGFNVDSVTTLTRVTLTLTIRPS